MQFLCVCWMIQMEMQLSTKIALCFGFFPLAGEERVSKQRDLSEYLFYFFILEPKNKGEILMVWFIDWR